MNHADENSVLYGRSPVETWPTILVAARYLLANGLSERHPWKRAALNCLPKVDLPGLTGREEFDAAADGVWKRIRKERLIGEVKLAALIVTHVRVEAFDGDNAQYLACRKDSDCLTANVLAAALLRAAETPEQSAIWNAATNMRLLNSKCPDRLFFLNGFLDWDDPQKLMVAVHKAWEKEGSTKAKAYLQSLTALFNSVISDKYVVQGTLRTRTNKEQSNPLSVEAIAPFDGPHLIVGGYIPHDTSFAGPDELQLADEIITQFVVEGEADPKKTAPRSVEVRRLGQVAKAAARRSLSLACDDDPMTTHEVRILMDRLRQKDHESPQQKQARLHLLADLVFGTAYGEGTSWAIDIQTRVCGRSLSVDLPGFEHLDTRTRTRVIDDCLVLFWPQKWGDALFSPRDEKAIDQVLKGLRTKLARSLTVKRIRRFKADWLRRRGVDQAVIGFLVGEVPRNLAQMHYTHVDIEYLTDLHKTYLIEGLGMRFTDSDWPAPFKEGLYGSRQRLPKDFVGAIFKEARKDVRVNRVEGFGSIGAVAEAHNRYLVYTLLVLYLATGHRPVSHPFEFYRDFDLDSRLLWINDKTRRGNTGTRLVVLAEQACAQVQFWVDHLKGITARLSLTHPQSASRVKQALCLDSKDCAPLFFAMSREGGIDELHPALQQTLMVEVMPAALNWTRHYMRSALVRNKCSAEAIDAFWGHGHLAQNPFVAGSSLGLSGLYAVASEIEKELAGLCIKAIEGPL